MLTIFLFLFSFITAYYSGACSPNLWTPIRSAPILRQSMALKSLSYGKENLWATYADGTFAAMDLKTGNWRSFFSIAPEKCYFAWVSSDSLYCGTSISDLVIVNFVDLTMDKISLRGLIPPEDMGGYFEVDDNLLLTGRTSILKLRVKRMSNGHKNISIVKLYPIPSVLHVLSVSYSALTKQVYASGLDSFSLK